MVATAPPVAVASGNQDSRPGRRQSPRVPAPLAVAVLCGVIATIIYAASLSSSGGEPMAVAARPIVAGEALSPRDFRFVDATLPGEARARMLGHAEVAAIAGQVARHSIDQGALVAKADVAAAAAPSRQRAVSLPLEPERAVGGRLARGDVVDVVDVTSGEAVYIVTDAEVLDVGIESGSRSSASSTSGRYAVTLALDDREALRVGAAVISDKVYLVRSTGAPAAAAAPPTTLGARR